MRYQITGKQIDIGESLQVHVRDNMDEMHLQRIRAGDPSRDQSLKPCTRIVGKER